MAEVGSVFCPILIIQACFQNLQKTDQLHGVLKEE